MSPSYRRSGFIAHHGGAGGFGDGVRREYPTCLQHGVLFVDVGLSIARINGSEIIVSIAPSSSIFNYALFIFRPLSPDRAGTQCTHFVRSWTRVVSRTAHQQMRGADVALMQVRFHSRAVGNLRRPRTTCPFPPCTAHPPHSWSCVWIRTNPGIAIVLRRLIFRDWANSS